MNWKISLDIYLTEPPDDGFDGWCESSADFFTEKFYNDNQLWLDAYDGQCNKWLCELFYKKGKSPQDAAIIIERAFRRYINLVRHILYSRW